MNSYEYIVEMNDPFLDGYLPYVLRRADQALSAPFYQSLTRHGVQRSEWRVLAVLREHDSMSMTDLTSTALSPQPTVSHAVARLAERGLVQRFRGTHDRRLWFVACTESGRTLADTLVSEAHRTETDALVGAGIHDISELVEELNSLHTKLADSLVAHR